MNERKEINPNRFYWNPNTKEKIYTHYIIRDERGRFLRYEEITKDKLDQKKIDEAIKECNKQSIADVESSVKLKEKPDAKRGRKPEHEEIVKEVKKELEKKNKK